MDCQHEVDWERGRQDGVLVVYWRWSHAHEYIHIWQNIQRGWKGEKDGQVETVNTLSPVKILDDRKMIDLLMERD